jgi:uncharacterized membrane protein YgcG
MGAFMHAFLQSINNVDRGNNPPPAGGTVRPVLPLNQAHSAVLAAATFVSFQALWSSSAVPAYQVWNDVCLTYPSPNSDGHFMPSRTISEAYAGS